MLHHEEEIGPVRWGLTALGGIVTLILLIAVAFTGMRWSLKQFDQLVDAKSIIKVENMKQAED